MDHVSNFAKGTIDGAFDITDTEIPLIDGGAAHFPAAPFNAVWWNATDYPDPADDPTVEIVRVTAVDVDTFTVDRGQEGTVAEEHNLAGKTYKMIAGLTAEMILRGVAGDVFGSGPAIAFDLDTPNTRWRYSDTDDRYMQMDNGGTTVQSVRVFAGDTQGVGNSGMTDLDDANSRFTLSNLNLATTQIESATVAVGTLAGKLAIRDGAGDIVGYLPIYTSIA